MVNQTFTFCKQWLLNYQSLDVLINKFVFSPLQSAWELASSYIPSCKYKDDEKIILQLICF